VQRLNERDKLGLIAEAGVKQAIIQVNKEEDKSYHALKDGWSNNIGVFKDKAVGDGKFNIRYSLKGEADLPTQRWGLVDEERKININKIDSAALKRLFQIVAGLDEVEAQELAASIVDWRDSDSESSIPSGSAEDTYYRYLKYPYECKDAEFEILDELLLVKGVTEKIFMQIKSYVTIYGNGKVNVNTAPLSVLLSLGLSQNVVEKIVLFRNGPDSLEATEDDYVFDDASGITTSLNQLYPLSEAENEQLHSVAMRYLNIQSSYFMANSIAQLNNRDTTVQVNSVIDQNGIIFSWQES